MEKDSLGFLISDVARLMRYRFDGRARKIGVTRPQWRLLVLLSRLPGATQVMLADRLEVERITLCRMIDRLEEAGLVERRPDPDDRRVWRIFPTGEGEKITRKLDIIGTAFREEIFSLLEPGEAEQLQQGLIKLRDALSKRNDDMSATA